MAGGAPGLLLRGRFPDVGICNQFQGERVFWTRHQLERGQEGRSPPPGRLGGSAPPALLQEGTQPHLAASPGAWRGVGDGVAGSRGEGGLFPLLEQEVGVTERRRPHEP